MIAVFDYVTSHDVVEVSKAGYDACSPSTPLASYNDGSYVTGDNCY